MPSLPRVLCLLSFCVLAVATASAGDDVPTREAIERDLKVEASLSSPASVQPGEPVRVTSRIVNRSKTASYKLVKPGDGSESGWREPHVFFTATTVDPRGVRTPVPALDILRCGLHDPNWHDEVVTLAPGAVLELTDWMPAANLALDFQQQGSVELRLHYKYARGNVSKGAIVDAPAGTGPMGDTPAFELVSKPVRFNVVRYVDIRLEVTGKLEVGKEALLSDAVRLHVKNLSADPVSVSSAEIFVQVVPAIGSGDLFSVFERIAPTVERKTVPLAGSATRMWDGTPAWNELADVRMTPAKPGSIEIEAMWSPTGGKARYRSARVEVEIVRP